jgi:hypothetical protein
MRSIRPALLALFTLGLVISIFSSGIAQTHGDLTDFWEMETRYTYSISTWNTEVGQSTGTFAGIAQHASVGNKYLFRTETKSKKS